MSTGLTGENIQNEATPKRLRTRSKFPLTKIFWNTNRFGEISPHDVIDCNDAERFEFGSAHEVQSYTLKAPLMQGIRMKKDYFRVNMRAILPLNWDKFYDNPNIGQDVQDNVGTGVEFFWYNIGRLFKKNLTDLITIVNDTSQTEETRLTSFLRFLVFGEYLYSNGNLLSCLGTKGSPFIRIFDGTNHRISYDTMFDSMITSIMGDFVGGYIEVTFDSGVYHVVWDENDEYLVPGNYPVIHFRQFLDMVRDELSFSVSDASGLSGAIDYSFLTLYTINTFPSTNTVKSPLNLARLWAYQICCFHFFTNDRVDYIFSADLFRQYVEQNGLRLLGVGSQSFTVNGLSYRYDSCSAYVFNNIITFFLSGTLNFYASSGTSLNGLDYLSSLFAYRRSLRYLDYFTGSRSRPLAVGGTDVQVNSNLVSIIDVTKNIQRQRFFNAINRSGRKPGEYLKELFGVAPSHDNHDPFWLGSTSDLVYGEKSEYTGNVQNAQQNNITSLLKSGGNRYNFSTSVDDNCIILGLTYFDIDRAYCKSNDRQTMYLNRFDYFNPFMQFIGDQEIYSAELGVDDQSNPQAPFSYTLRHMEYKQRYNTASGGFVEALPAWSFHADDVGRNYLTSINPDFIRNVNEELDKFYLSLTGWSLGHYFHFIIKNYNRLEASRPMAFAPSIL